jgi:hypothetical protein
MGLKLWACGAHVVSLTRMDSPFSRVCKQLQSAPSREGRCGPSRVGAVPATRAIPPNSGADGFAPGAFVAAFVGPAEHVDRSTKYEEGSTNNRRAKFKGRSAKEQPRVRRQRVNAPLLSGARRRAARMGSPRPRQRTPDARDGNGYETTQGIMRRDMRAFKGKAGKGRAATAQPSQSPLPTSTFHDASLLSLLVGSQGLWFFTQRQTDGDGWTRMPAWAQCGLQPPWSSS